MELDNCCNILEQEHHKYTCHSMLKVIPEGFDVIQIATFTVLCSSILIVSICLILNDASNHSSMLALLFH
jgi:hypothetical protein